MKMSKFKKFVATAMMVIMAIGSTMTAYAVDDSASVNGATGWGDSTNHLDTNYIKIQLPTNGTVKKAFNFWVDPENIIARADLLPDGVSADKVANDQLVYFAVSEDGVRKYSSTSSTVSFNLMNYVSANLTVIATVSDNGSTAIPLVSAGQIEANKTAKVPSLNLKINVSTNQAGDKTDSEDIVGTSVTVQHAVSGQDAKFSVSLNKKQVVNSDGSVSQGSISYNVTPSGNTVWDYGKVTLSGICTPGTVDKTMLAPVITLTWKFEAKDAKPASYLSVKKFTSTVTSAQMTLPAGVTLSKVTLAKAGGIDGVDLENSTHYTVSGTTFQLTSRCISDKADWISRGYTEMIITFSDNHAETVTLE